MRQLLEVIRRADLATKWLVIAAALASAACTGIVTTDASGSGSAQGCSTGVCSGAGAGTSTGNSADGSDGALAASPGEAAMRRLNTAEYQNTVRDLFGSAGTTIDFPDEGRTQGFDTSSTALAVSPLHIQAYLDAAAELVSELFGAEGQLRSELCDFRSADEAANSDCAGRIVSDFAALAWRRPHAAWPDAQAEADYLELLEPSGALAQPSLEQRLRTALEAVLVSARFVYRVEFADDGGNLDTPSLASRLSYFLWSSAPDSELSSSDLHDSATLEAQLARIQEDPRFERFLQRFPQMWLELEKLDSVERDVAVYPDYSPELVMAVGQETRQFFANYWRDPSGTVSGILLAPNPAPAVAALAKLYGDSPRLGLITQASIMTLTGASNRTAPVRRGKWVLERLLCAPPPPPPDGVIAELTEELEADATLTERERLERHRVSPACAGCHALMDPIGLGFENYDSIGAYRTVDASGQTIDPSGKLGDSETFAGPMELIALLAQDERLVGCVIRQLLTYGTGRTYDANDDGLIESARLSAGGAMATFSRVLSSVVQSDGFRRREEQ